MIKPSLPWYFFLFFLEFILLFSPLECRMGQIGNWERTETETKRIKRGPFLNGLSDLNQLIRAGFLYVLRSSTLGTLGVSLSTKDMFFFFPSLKSLSFSSAAACATVHRSPPPLSGEGKLLSLYLLFSIFLFFIFRIEIHNVRVSSLLLG